MRLWKGKRCWIVILLIVMLEIPTHTWLTMKWMDKFVVMHSQVPIYLKHNTWCKSAKADHFNGVIIVECVEVKL